MEPENFCNPLLSMDGQFDTQVVLFPAHHPEISFAVDGGKLLVAQMSTQFSRYVQLLRTGRAVALPETSEVPFVRTWETRVRVAKSSDVPFSDGTRRQTPEAEIDATEVVVHRDGVWGRKTAFDTDTPTAHWLRRVWSAVYASEIEEGCRRALESVFHLLFPSSPPVRVLAERTLYLRVFGTLRGASSEVAEHLARARRGPIVCDLQGADPHRWAVTEARALARLFQDEVDEPVAFIAPPAVAICVLKENPKSLLCVGRTDALRTVSGSSRL